MLLERDHVLDELDELAAQVAAGQGLIAFIVGEAGIGKTSVLRAAAQRLNGRLRCLWSACEDLSATEALTLLRDLSIIDQGALDHANDGGSRMALFQSTLSQLADTPTALLIEDLHWADDSSIDFLRYVGRRVNDQPLLVIVSSRNEDQGARSRLARAVDIPPAARRRFDLTRLSSAAVGQLAAAHGLIGAVIHDVTDGNPLFVSEMLTHGGTRPDSIDDLVISRANRLDPAARAFLDYCSIIPRRVSLDQILAAGIEDDIIQRCIESGLLLSDGDGLAFRHEVTRRVVEDALTAFRRRQLHALELERLKKSGASAARRLHHAIAADDRAYVSELAPEAARQASALGAHREAARAWATIFDKASPPSDPAYHERFAFELHVIGDMPEAIYWLQEALTIYRSADDRLKEGDCLRFLSRLHYLNGTRALADEAGNQAVTLLESFPGTAELALAYANLGQLAMLADHNDEAFRWAERAIPIARALGRDDILATAFNDSGTSLQHRDVERGLALLDESLALGLAVQSREHVARSYINKGWVLMSARRLEDAKVPLQAGMHYCRTHDLDTWGDYLTGGLALTFLDLGDWEEACRIAQPVAAGSQSIHLMRNPAIRTLALVGIRTGGDGVDALIDETHDYMVRGREAPRFCALAAMVAERAWTTGDGQEEALALLREAASLTRPDGNPWDRGSLWFWQRKLGVDDPSLVDLSTPHARLANGDVANAAEWFAVHSMPFEQAMMLVEGDQDQAIAGLAQLDRLGATATAARVRTLLSAQGIRLGPRGPRSSTRSNRFGLTKREIDVLAALDKGLTNKEIGEKLFVSAKTVDHHVSSILGKIEARTRGEAAALARNHGLID